jgi:arylsulfatase A-like enzyme
VRWFALLVVTTALAVSFVASAAGRPHAAPPVPASAEPADAQRWNVVFIVSDDENVYGNAVMTNVSRLLARHGVTFTDFHVTTPECGPSRASILTGLYAHHSGVTGNFGPHGYPAFDQSANLAVWLKNAGYRTALVGKFINDYSLDGHNATPPGWDDWQAMDSVPLEKYYDYTLDENGRLVHYGNSADDYSTTVLAGKALDFLRRVRRPFFLYYAPVTPHLPAIPAPADVGRFDRLAPFASPALNQRNVSGEPWAAWHKRAISLRGLSYIGAVRRHQLEALRSLDRSVGQIVALLRRRRLLDRTVIFYTSDNGFLWGEHRLGGKLWPYEESTRVPLVVRTPWTRANGTTVAKPVLNIDFASTIDELTGTTPVEAQDGRSFVPFLEGDRVPWRTDYLLEYLGKNALRVGGPPPYVAIHTARYVYVEYRYRHWRELYDLRRDPWELDNLAGDPAYARIEGTLARRLTQLYDAGPSSPIFSHSRGAESVR